MVLCGLYTTVHPSGFRILPHAWHRDGRGIERRRGGGRFAVGDRMETVWGGETDLCKPSVPFGGGAISAAVAHVCLLPAAPRVCGVDVRAWCVAGTTTDTRTPRGRRTGTQVPTLTAAVGRRGSCRPCSPPPCPAPAHSRPCGVGRAAALVREAWGPRPAGTAKTSVSTSRGRGWRCWRTQRPGPCTPRG